MDGIIVINKYKGCTSFDIVSKIRKIYNTKKVGHIGTLDPNATGVLPILLGNATKLSEYLINHKKTYIATMKLGERTDTGDIEGNIIETKRVEEHSKEMIKEVLNTFVGHQKQIPPIYSAIKVNGKKLYDYAREGKKVDIPERDIEIYNIELKNSDKLEITYKVECSKGTYIRTLCEDIANKLGTVAYMKDLERTAIDEFNIENSYTLDEVKDGNAKIISIEEFFKDSIQIILNEEQIRLFLNGGRINVGKIIVGGDASVAPFKIIRIYNSQNKFIGTGVLEKNIVKRHIVI